MRTTDEYLLDIKCMLNGRKAKGWSAFLPNQSPVGFAKISIRDYANGCRATGSLFRGNLSYKAISPSRCCVCFGKNNQKRLSGKVTYTALFISIHQKHRIAFGPSELGIR